MRVHKPRPVKYETYVARLKKLGLTDSKEITHLWEHYLAIRKL